MPVTTMLSTLNEDHTRHMSSVATTADDNDRPALDRNPGPIGRPLGQPIVWIDIRAVVTAMAERCPCLACAATSGEP
jgi:hypothetical protein